MTGKPKTYLQARKFLVAGNGGNDLDEMNEFLAGIDESDIVGKFPLALKDCAWILFLYRCEDKKAEPEGEPLDFTEGCDPPIEEPNSDLGQCPLCGAKLALADGGDLSYCPEGCLIV